MEKQLLISLFQSVNFEEGRRFLNRSPHECLHQLNEAGVRKWIQIDGADCLFDLMATNDQQLQAVVRIGQPSMHTVLERYIREWWDLDRDLEPFNQQMQPDALMGPLAEEYRYLRLIGIPDLFEALCWSVIGQQINLNFAYALKKRMVEAWGSSFVFEEKTYYHFPSPEKIAALTPPDFQPFQFSRRKAEYIIGIAQLMAEGHLSKGALQTKSSEEIADHLLKIRGVGNWTAQYVLMKCFQRASAFPTQDAGLQNAIKYLRKMDRKPTQEELLQWAIPWKGWEAYATFYFWQSIISEK